MHLTPWSYGDSAVTESVFLGFCFHHLAKEGPFLFIFHVATIIVGGSGPKDTL